MEETLSKREREQKAFDTAVKYLAVSPRSEKEVKERLYKKGFHKSEVEFAIEKAKGYRYINDEMYVKSFLEYYKHRYGVSKLKYKLTTEKGIDKELAQNLIEDTISEEYETEIAQKFAEKYVLRKKLEKKEIKKVGAFLYQKGFEWNIINNVLSNLFNEDFDF